VVVAYNVYLKRLENKGNRAKAERIDKIGDWLYPLLYVGAFGTTTLVFFSTLPFRVRQRCPLKPIVMWF
jgi:hypothetical protein